MAIPGGFDVTDVTGRMAMFGQSFGRHVGVPEPRLVPRAAEVVAIVRARVPSTTGPGEDAPVFEAAAYVGEWLRSHAHASWIAEGPMEPNLQVVDETRAIVHIVPLVSLFRTAATAGYDGLPAMLDLVLEDVHKPAVRARVADIRVLPETDRTLVADWILRNRGATTEARAVLWRRCHHCGAERGEEVDVTDAPDDWEETAAMAADVLSARPFACACGGPAGEKARFLLLVRDEEGERIADIMVTGRHTRVSCWRLEGEDVVPYAATSWQGA